MKKLLNFLFLLSLPLLILSCSKEKKTPEKSTTSVAYTIDSEHSSVQWTAFKTSDKLPVKGTFKEIKILKSTDGTTASMARESRGRPCADRAAVTIWTSRSSGYTEMHMALWNGTARYPLVQHVGLRGTWNHAYVLPLGYPEKQGRSTPTGPRVRL